MRMGRKPQQIIRNVFLYLLTAVLLFTIVPEIPVQAAGVTDEEAEKEQEYTEEELYDMDDGDGEYWKYYDAEGNSVREQEALEGDGYTSNSDGNSSESDGEVVSPYTGKHYTVLSGYDVSHAVDVSKYQEDIDWKSVKADGVESVIIRCAYRGYGSSGSLVTDPYFTENIEGALAAGLHVGIYIYSQAITKAEGIGEAQKCLDLCADYLDQLDLPIVMDVEYAAPDGTAGGRLYDAGLSKSEQTAICQAFAQTIYDAGYQPMIYANKTMLTSDMNPTILTDEGDQIWLAHYTTNTDYSASPYVLWQYSSSGTVSGISGAADMNFIFTKELEQKVPVWKSISATADSVKLTWENVAGVDGYEIQRSTDGENWSSLAALKAGAATSYTDKVETKEAAYYYRICTYFTKDGSTEYGSFSESISTASAVAVKLPAPVLKSAKSASYNSIKISWDAVDGTEGYRLYRKVSGGSWKKLADITSLSYTDTTANTGTTYYYTVRGYYKLNGEIVWGQYDTSGISGKAVMVAPVLKSAESAGYNSIKVSWDAIDGTEGYRLYRKVSGGSWKKLKDTASLNYIDTTAECGTTYYYTVRGYCTVNGKIVWGQYDTKGISGKAVMAAPVLKSAESASYNSIKVSWNAIDGTEGYRLYRKVSGGSWKKLKDTTSLSYTDTTAECGTTYYYTVRGYCTVNGKIVWGQYDTKGISGQAIPSTPSFTLSSTTTGKVEISWNKISGATGYVVYRKNLTTGEWERIKNITSPSTVSYTASGTSGATVYYTVRAYRTVNGTNVYSKYKSDVCVNVK